MKRLTLIHVLAIFTACSLFVIYLLACFPVLNRTVFSWNGYKGVRENGSQILGNIIGSSTISGIGNSSSTIINGTIGNNSNNNSGNDNTCNIAYSSDNINNTLTFHFKNPVKPEIPDYILVNLTAKNNGQAKYPYGSIAVNLSEEKIGISGSDSTNKSVKDLSQNTKMSERAEINAVDSTEIYLIQERARIFIDGTEHTYYIPVGENKYWRYIWNIDGPSLKGQINSLEIEIPKINGIDIQINSITLNKRIIFAADSHVNYFFKSYFQLSYIDRYLTPAYIFLIFFIAFFPLFCFLLNKESNIVIRKAGGIIGNLRTLATLLPLLLLIFFSFYFINNYIFTVKGYWDSYKQYIISGRVDETYYGFSDFKKFVTWVDGKVPEGNNIIVLVKGEPVYIMAQMSYGLYPKDVKFIDINDKNAEQIKNMIDKINSGADNNYKYLIAISDADIGKRIPVMCNSWINTGRAEVLFIFILPVRVVWI